MTICPACQKEIQTDWQVCPYCQAALDQQTRDIGFVSGKTEQSTSLADCYRNSWAVVIGINEYRDVPKLSYGVADANAVTEALTNVGFKRNHIITLLDADATRQNIQDTLSVEMARQTTPDDRLLVFFAGHGQDYDAASGRKMGYLIPVDGNPDYLASRCISMAEVDTWSDLIPAKHILFVMDCCYSGLAATRDSGLNPNRNDYVNQVVQRPVRQIITAGRSDQKVLEESGQGIFTRAFIRGIRGDADIHGRGFVSGFDLGHYLETRVHEESNWRQQPMFRYLRGDGEFLVVPHGSSPSEQSGLNHRIEPGENESASVAADKSRPTEAEVATDCAAKPIEPLGNDASKQLWDFVRSDDGLYIDDFAEAQAWVSKRVEYFQTHHFDAWKELFCFAHSEEELCLDAPEAEAWADRKMPLLASHDFETWKGLFSYAQSETGLSLYELREAEEWADSAIQREVSTATVAPARETLWKQLWDFVRSDDGLYIDDFAEAQAWVSKRVVFFEDHEFTKWKELFQFAQSEEELYLDASEAEAWADCKISFFASHDFERWKELFSYAQSEDGLSLLEIQEAEEWADSELLRNSGVPSANRPTTSDTISRKRDKKTPSLSEQQGQVENKHRRKQGGGISILELLVILAVIAILVAMFVDQARQKKEQGNRIQTHSRFISDCDSYMHSYRMS